VCTVLLRLTPDSAWPLVLAAVRDEFIDRAWDPPAAFWPDTPAVVGGRDRTGGGTWLAVHPDRPAVAALLNGARLDPPTTGVRPSRGGLVLAALAGQRDFDATSLAGYDGFHLVLGEPDGVTVWSWDGVSVRRQELAPGNHIIVNGGVDTVDDPLVPHFAPLLAALPDPAPLTGDTAQAWGSWVELLAGDHLSGDDPRALLVRISRADRTYGSSSASLIALGRRGVRFDFTATPADPAWYPVPAEPAGPRV
jgi:uncharacterized protein with NRDE domain